MAGWCTCHTVCASRASLSNMCFVATRPSHSAGPSHLRPRGQDELLLRKRLRRLDAAVQGSRRLVGRVSNAETLPLSYQSTPHFIRTPSLHQMPPLTLAAHAPCRQRYASRMVTAGRAARPKDIFYLHVAGGQVVGSAGGADGVLFSGSWALLAGPRRDLGLQRPSDGGRGFGRVPVGPCICESIYTLVFFCTI